MQLDAQAKQRYVKSLICCKLSSLFLFVDVGTCSKIVARMLEREDRHSLPHPHNVQSRSTYELLAFNPSLQHTNEANELF